MAKKKSAPKKKVYYSFDAPDDNALKDFAVGQNKNKSTPFKAQNKSLNKPVAQSKWEKEAEKKIKSSDMLMVILGDKTHRAQGVKKEIEMARKHGKEVVQVKPKKNNPKRVENAGRMYNWTHDNMENLLKKKK